MKKLVLVAAILLAAVSAKAQDYNWAAGVRGGGTASGVNIKHILSDGNAFELSFDYLYPYTQDNGTRQNAGKVLTGFYEWNAPLQNDSFIFYAGFGGHVGAASKTKSLENDPVTRFLVGIDGVAGIEYKIPNFPIAFSIDWRPFFEFATMNPRLYNAGIGVKLCF